MKPKFVRSPRFCTFPLIMYCILLCLLPIVICPAISRSQPVDDYQTVGLKAGDWVTYRVSKTYLQLLDVEAVRVLVQDLSGASVTVNVTYRLKGGNEDLAVSSGSIQNLTLRPFGISYLLLHTIPWAIPSNFTFDDEFVNSLVRPSRFSRNFTWGSYVFNQSYGGIYRTVGLLNMSWAEPDLEEWRYYYIDWTWDRQTGVLLSMSADVYYRPGVYFDRLYMEITDTSLWPMAEPLFQLPKLAMLGTVPLVFASSAVVLYRKRRNHR